MSLKFCSMEFLVMIIFSTVQLTLLNGQATEGEPEVETFNCTTIFEGYHCEIIGDVPPIFGTSEECFSNRSGYYLNATYNGTNRVSLCVQCYFPHQCIQYNKCLIGTFGPTCEKCDQKNGYFKSGNSCVKCGVAPWSAICFVIFLCFVLPLIKFRGFTDSAFIKLKILMDFSQFMFLILFIKHNWVQSLLPIFLTNLSFVTFSNRVLPLECYGASVETGYYTDWFMLLWLPFTVAMLLFIDKRMVGRMKKLAEANNMEEVEEMWKTRQVMRRFCVFLLFWSFMPVLHSTLHTTACAKYAPFNYSFGERDVFLLDQNAYMTCAKPLFQILQLMLIVTTVVYIIFGLPVVLYFYVITWRWDYFQKYHILYGPLYDSYKKNFCFWDFLNVARKLFSVVLTDFLPVSPVLTSRVILSFSVLYIIPLIIFRPFKKFYWVKIRSYQPNILKRIDIHNYFEILSTAVLIILQTAVLLNVHQEENDKRLEVTAICLVVLVFLIWIFMFVQIPYEKREFQLEEWDPPDITAPRSSFFVRVESPLNPETSHLTEAENSNTLETHEKEEKTLQMHDERKEKSKLLLKNRQVPLEENQKIQPEKELNKETEENAANQGHFKMFRRMPTSFRLQQQINEESKAE